MRSKLTGLICATILAVAFSTSATAQNPSAATGTITSITSLWGGEGIYLTMTPTPSPACDGKLFMPTSAIQYKENLALAMLALSQGLSVIVYYNTTCNSSGNIPFVSLGVG